MHDLTSCFVLGFHGCTWDVAKCLVMRCDTFRKSENNYDWLGHGIYFWLENPRRACEWAQRHVQTRAPGARPAVVGAVIDLGNCLDLTTAAGIEQVQRGFRTLKELISLNNESMPENVQAHDGDADRLIRRLDCAVINTTCDVLELEGQPIDTVKGMFTEGGSAYDGACIMRHTHVQVAVRNPACIRSVFLPPREMLGDMASTCNDTAC